MHKLSIYDLRAGYEAYAANQDKPSHFFDRQTLKFFHETMKSLRMGRTSDPRIYTVTTRHNMHYFRIVGDGDYPFFELLGTTRPEGLV